MLARRLAGPCCLTMEITGAPALERRRSGWRAVRRAWLIRLQHVAETPQSAHLEPVGSEPPSQAMHTDLDRSVGRRVTSAAQTVGDRLLAHDAARADGE